MASVHGTLVAVVLGVAGAGWLSVPASAGEQKLDGKEVLSSSGYVVPARQVAVSAQVPGLVVELLAEEGLRVKKGDLLARLDATEYQLESRRAQALIEEAQARLKGLEAGARKEEVARAEAALNEEKARLEYLRQDSQRLQKLREVAPNVPTDEDRARARSAVLQSQARLEGLHQELQLLKVGARPEKLDEARAALKVAEVEAARAHWRLDQTSIRAPFDGTVLSKRVEVGSLVFAGQRCTFTPDAAPDKVYKGQVVRLLPIADRARGAIFVRMRLEVPATDQTLRPEMRVVVRFFGKE